MKKAIILVLGAILSIPAFSSTWCEVGALWHDGKFAPFISLATEVSAIGFMYGEPSHEEDHASYLIWIEAREEGWAIMLGARIDPTGNETECDPILEGIEIWQFWGWWVSWEKGEEFARGGQIYAWHDDIWTVWPLIDLGLQLK